MEPAVLEKCPWPVPACGHRTAPQQHGEQVTRAISPHSNTRALKESVGGERGRLRKDQAVWLPGSAAVPGFFFPPPLHTAKSPCSSTTGLQERIPGKLVTAGSILLYVL